MNEIKNFFLENKIINYLNPYGMNNDKVNRLRHMLQHDRPRIEEFINILDKLPSMCATYTKAQMLSNRSKIIQLWFQYPELIAWYTQICKQSPDSFKFQGLITAIDIFAPNSEFSLNFFKDKKENKNILSLENLLLIHDQIEDIFLSSQFSKNDPDNFSRKCYFEKKMETIRILLSYHLSFGKVDSLNWKKIIEFNPIQINAILTIVTHLKRSAILHQKNFDKILKHFDILSIGANNREEIFNRLPNYFLITQLQFNIIIDRFENSLTTQNAILACSNYFDLIVGVNTLINPNIEIPKTLINFKNLRKYHDGEFELKKNIHNKLYLLNEAYNFLKSAPINQIYFNIRGNENSVLVLLQAMVQWNGIVIGEDHSKRASKKILIDHLPYLQKIFADKGYYISLRLEHLISEEHQHLLDQYLASESMQMPTALESYLQWLDAYFKLQENGKFHPYSFTGLVMLAKMYGIKIIAMDSGTSYAQTATEAREAMDRYALLAHRAANIKISENEISIFFVGFMHTNMQLGIPGISQLTTLPSLLLEDLNSESEDEVVQGGDLAELHKSKAHVSIKLNSRLESPIAKELRKIYATIHSDYSFQDTKNFYPPLYFYISQGAKENLIQLLENNHDIDIRAKDCFGYTSIDLAARRGHVEILNLLLDYDKNYIKETESDRMINIALESEQLPIIDFLKEKQINLSDSEEKQYQHLLKKNKFVESVLNDGNNKLITETNLTHLFQNHDFIQKSPEQQAMLIKANVLQKTMRYLKDILDYVKNDKFLSDIIDKVTQAASQDYLTTLFSITEFHRIPHLQQNLLIISIVYQEFFLDPIKSASNLTPIPLVPGRILFELFAKNDISSLKILLNHGMNLHHTNEEGNTLLYLAVTQGKISMVKLLLGIEINDSVDNDTIESSSSNDFSDILIAKQLIELFNPVSQKNPNTIHVKSLLFFAIKENNLAAVKTFISLGLKIDEKNDQGLTPEQYADERGYSKIQEYLNEYRLKTYQKNNSQSFNFATNQNKPEIFEEKHINQHEDLSTNIESLS